MISNIKYGLWIFPKSIEIGPLDEDVFEVIEKFWKDSNLEEENAIKGEKLPHIPTASYTVLGREITEIADKIWFW